MATIGITLNSCISLQWKYNYMAERIVSLKKYQTDTSRIEFSLSSSLTKGKKIKQLRKKKIIKIMDTLEHAVALFPDSVSSYDGRVDSFYFNSYKIQFIKVHGYLGKNKYLIEKTN